MQPAEKRADRGAKKAETGWMPMETGTAGERMGWLLPAARAAKGTALKYHSVRVQRFTLHLTPVCLASRCYTKPRQEGSQALWSGG